MKITVVVDTSVQTFCHTLFLNMHDRLTREALFVHDTEFTVQHFLSSVTMALAAAADIDNIALCRVLYRVIL